MPSSIGCGLGGGDPAEYSRIIECIAKKFPRIRFILVSEEEDVHRDNLDLVKFRLSSDVWSSEREDEKCAELEELIRNLHLFAQIERIPVVEPTPKSRAATYEKDYVGTFFEECVDYFEPRLPPADDRHVQVLNAWESLGDAEVLRRTEENLNTIRKMRTLISERRVEGTDIRPRLIKALARAIGWPDETPFLDDCKLIGNMRNSVYPIEFGGKQRRKGKFSRRHLIANVQKISEKVLRRASKRTETKHLETMKKEAFKLADEGKVEIESVASFIRRRAFVTHLLSPNFGVAQGSKIRMCTDYSSSGSGLNDACHIWNRCVLHDHSHMARMILFCGRKWKRIRLWKSDLRGAYRQLPLSARERRLGTMLLGDLVLLPLTLGFGARAAVFNFTAFSLLVTSIVTCITAAPTCVYIDDEFGVLPERSFFGGAKAPLDTASRVFDSAQELHALMGVNCYPVDLDKTFPPSDSIPILGLDVFTGECGDFDVAIPAKKKAKIMDRIESGIRLELDREVAGKLAGQLCWVSFGTANKVGNNYIKPVYAFSYGEAGPERCVIGLVWWRSKIDEIAPGQRLRCDFSPKGQWKVFLAFSDASDWYVGGLLFRGSRYFVTPSSSVNYREFFGEASMHMCTVLLPARSW
jgi:hypothetical protein